MTILQYCGLLVVTSLTWTLWRLFRHFILPSTLDNLPGPPPESWMTGVLEKVFSNDAWSYHKHISSAYNTSTIKWQALFGEKELFTFDPRAMHHIFVKDQHLFEETEEFIQANRTILGPGLLGSRGEQHRKQRKMLNPVFSIAHMRKMVPTFYKITHELRDKIAAKVQDGPQEVECLSWMSRTALELICQSGFGVSFNALDDNPHPYITAAQSIVPALSQPTMRYGLGFLLPTLSKIGPASFRRWVVNILPWKDLHAVRDIVNTLHETSVKIFEEKRKALEGSDPTLLKEMGDEKDIMTILMKANMSASKEDSLSREELIAQMSTLMLTAMDTTASALARLIHLLVMNQDVQNKLRLEIIEAKQKEGGDLPYDTLVSLPYLDAICRETLRLHTPVLMARRVTLRDTVLPLLSPIKGLNGEEITEVHVSKGTHVNVGLVASNTNIQLWGPDAGEWKPERWLSPLPEELGTARIPGIYSHLMTFIGGGRACIGFKFSQLEMKAVLVTLIESFHFSPSQAEIAWKTTHIVSPTVVGGDPELPMLPLLVERV